MKLAVLLAGVALSAGWVTISHDTPYGGCTASGPTGSRTRASAADRRTRSPLAGRPTRARPAKPGRVDVGGGLGIVPSVAAGDGLVAVTYSAVSGDARYWLATSRDGGKSFHRAAIGPAFRLADAPLLAGDPAELVPPGLFLGDYEGLAVQGGRAYTAFATANPDPANPTDIRYVRR